MALEEEHAKAQGGVQGDEEVIWRSKARGPEESKRK